MTKISAPDPAMGGLDKQGGDNLMEKASEGRGFRPIISPRGGGIILLIWSNPLLLNFPLLCLHGRNFINWLACGAFLWLHILLYTTACAAYTSRASYLVPSTGERSELDNDSLPYTKGKRFGKFESF